VYRQSVTAGIFSMCTLSLLTLETCPDDAEELSTSFLAYLWHTGDQVIWLQKNTHY